ncbi:Holliday junction resolvase YqgF [Petrotoga mobilis SJ95]|uniref:Holliday junction resolvase YqgF n=1 Tax=Petrotoga mobilis (strain DSM 10674 / SJ95) TaxID=403833 RepID=A9BF14_PETMO|nr:RuvX/YqgF family protein [Petrotoga mobilis]ABX31078.1 Holliday junction resolvase YqgF [Petrotoga mobilis SJ95]
MGVIKNLKVYGIDYGTSNCGIAILKQDVNIPLPKETIKSEKLLEFLVSLDLSHDDLIVFGLPISMSGRYSKQSFLSIDEAIKIKEKIGCKIYFVDERLTTSSLYSEVRGQVSYKKVKRTKDQNSSVLILSNFIQSPENAIALVEKEVYNLKKDFSCYKDILIWDVPINNELENFSIFAKDPWVFWYYYKKGFESTTLMSDLKDYYDLIITNKENREKIQVNINFNELMCL